MVIVVTGHSGDSNDREVVGDCNGINVSSLFLFAAFLAHELPYK